MPNFFRKKMARFSLQVLHKERVSAFKNSGERLKTCNGFTNIVIKLEKCYILKTFRLKIFLFYCK